MAACDQIFAVQANRSRLPAASWPGSRSFDALVANATELSDAKTKNNATRADELKAKAASHAAALAALQSNSTLTAFCSVEKTKATCHSMKTLEKEIELGANQTALDAKFKGNETKIARFQQQVERAKTKLAVLQGNETLSNACASLQSVSVASTLVQSALETAPCTNMLDLATSDPASAEFGIESGAVSIHPLSSSVSLVAVLLFVGLLL